MKSSPQIIAVSYNHKSTPVEWRDQIALSDELCLALIRSVLDNQIAQELAIISTCIRTEFYWITSNTPTKLMACLQQFYQAEKKITLPNQPEPLVLQNDQAVTHMLSVAAGMESMMLGENQILAQVKTSHDLILKEQFAFPMLNRLFQTAIQAGKAVRNRTALCQGATSISMAAVELARKVFTAFKKHRILLVGAGETAQLVATHFHELGAQNFVVANRSAERAQQIISKFGGEYIVLERIAEVLAQVDIVVTATHSPHYLITQQHIEHATKSRGGSPLLLIDISTPRNVEPEIKNLSDEFFLYNIDDLKNVVNINLDKRRGELPLAAKVVDEFCQQYLRWVKSLQLVPTITKLSGHFEQIRRQEIEKFANKVSPTEFERLDKLSQSLTKKLLHFPLSSLQHMTNGEQIDAEKISIIHEIYRLNTGNNENQCQ